ncbi:hypothetical protein [Streptomyces sp. NPDC048361]|uniref:hypothetical protein n=1 Tax=Streptomyces sp. NPDC048361 TaxID=3154720 RepID=UPI00343FFB5D
MAAAKGMGRPPTCLDEQLLSGGLCPVCGRDLGHFDEIDELFAFPAPNVPDTAEYLAGGSQFITDDPMLHSLRAFMLAWNPQQLGMRSDPFVSAGVDGQNSSKK